MTSHPRLVPVVALACFVASLLSVAWAEEPAVSWDLTQMGELPHQYYYTYGIDWTPDPGEEVTWARLTIKNVYDWRAEADHLYIHLLESAPLGKKVYWDGEGGGDAFADQGLFLIDWSDPVGGYPTGYDLVIDIPESHLGWLNGNFGIGLDPDCHYYNDGIILEVGTNSRVTPEPTTFALLGVSGLAFGAIRRCRKRRT